MLADYSDDIVALRPVVAAESVLNDRDSVLSRSQCYVDYSTLRVVDTPQPHTCSGLVWTSTPFAPGSGTFLSTRPTSTNIYTEIDLEMKAKALAKCEITGANNPKRHWRDDPALMTFLRTL
jgi:hypothetical protein